MRGSRNFCQRVCVGGGSLTARKQPGQRFLVCFFLLVLNLFYSLQRGSNGLLQRKLYFSKDRGGPTFLGGGGGSRVQVLISI